jgi:hypothetical protein
MVTRDGAGSRRRGGSSDAPNDVVTPPRTVQRSISTEFSITSAQKGEEKVNRDTLQLTLPVSQ